MNATDFLLTSSVDRAGRTAFLWRNRALTYGALEVETARAAHALAAFGLRTGERVLFQLKDTPTLVCAYLGAMKMGAVAVALNPRLTGEELAHVTADSGARLILCDQDSRAVTEAAVAAAGGAARVVMAGVPDASFETAMKAQSAHHDSALTVEDDMAFWVYTSGTTGRLKAAVHRHRDVVVSDLYPRQILDVRAGDILYATSKLFFAYALGTILFGTLRLSATAVLNDAPSDPTTVAAVVARHRPTIMFSVPTLYRSLLAAGVVEGTAFRRVRHYVSAGERLSPVLYDQWLARTGVSILDGMGASETIYMLLTNGAGRIRPGASGVPAPGAEVKLADAEGNPVAPGELGILWARIESCAARYWNQPEASTRAFRDGWFATGDLYRVDADGFWHHEGRADDLLKVAGQWVSPAEVEEVALSVAGVRDAALVGRSDASGLMRTTLYIVLTSGADGALEALRAVLPERLMSHKVPRDIRVVDAVPRTATGKLQRYKLREAAA
ncbi:MAG: benzoate-CoA ligase family protein [Alphaproteobacteria bacterium]